MRRLLWITGILCLLFAGVTTYLLLQPEYQPTLSIIGDIKNCRVVTSLGALGEPDHISLEDDTYQAVSLFDIINDSQPDGQVKQVVLISSDGFSAAIRGDSLKDCYIAYTASDGWRGVNPFHPINANAAHLEKIVVIAAAKTATNALTIVAPTKTARITVGSLYTGETIEYPYHEGTAEKETDGVTYTFIGIHAPYLRYISANGLCAGRKIAVIYGGWRERVSGRKCLIPVERQSDRLSFSGGSVLFTRY